MTSSISDLLHDTWNRIVALFGGPRALDSFSRDELLAEQVRLEQGERRILRELERLELEKSALFEAAKAEPSQAMRQVQARKIRDINHRSATLQTSLGRLSKQIRIADQLMAGQELGHMQRGSADIAGAIQATGSLEMQAWVEETVAQQAIAEQKTDEIIASLDEARTAQHASQSEDAEVAAILAEIDRAAASDALADEMALTQQAAPRATENAVAA